VAVLHRDAQGSEVRCDGLLLERDATDLLLNIRGRTKRIPREALIQVRLVTPQDDN
jgi:ribosome maturation factor RimP